MRRLMIGAVFLAAACGGSDSESGGEDASAGAASAGSADAQAVAQACSEYSNLAVEICDCMGERAAAELDADQAELLAVAMSGDGDRAEALTEDLGAVRAAQAMGFLTSAPMLCAAEVGPE